MPTIKEFDIQRALIIWLDGNPDRDGVPRVQPALMPGVVYWHTPNGGERRDAFEGKRLKQMGVKAGIPDLLFFNACRLYSIELKEPGAKRISPKQRSPERQAIRSVLLERGIANERTVDMLSDAQIDMHARLMNAGLAAATVADSLPDAKAFCFQYLLTICK